LIVELPTNGTFSSYKYDDNLIVFIFREENSSSEFGPFVGFLCKLRKGNSYKMGYEGRGKSVKELWGRLKSKELRLPKNPPSSLLGLEV